VLLKKQTVVHPVKLVATQNEIEFIWSFEKITEILPYSVCRSLVPPRTLWCLLRCEDFDKALRKIVEFITGVNMAM